MSVILMSAKCQKDDYHKIILIKNNSNSEISVSPSTTFPDTIIKCPLGHYEIKAGESHEEYQRNGWEPRLGKPQYIQFYILDPHIVDSLPCDSISKNHLIIKRYQLSVDDLNSMNWIVNYP